MRTPAVCALLIVGSALCSCGSSDSSESTPPVVVHWKASYAATCAPVTTAHHTGENCVSCHAQGGGATPFVYAGTMHRSNGTDPAPAVEVGVTDLPNYPTVFYVTCSDAAGNFWLDYSTVAVDVTWGVATLAVRNANGEKVMAKHGQRGCNSCHDASKPLLEP